MNTHSGYQGPHPDAYRMALQHTMSGSKPEENSPRHLFQAAHAVHEAVIENQERPRARDLQTLTRALDAMETRGYLLAGDDPGYHTAYRRLAEFTRTFVQADILQRLPNPPHWAPKYPETGRIEKHLRKIMEYATLMMRFCDQTRMDQALPFLDRDPVETTPALTH